jgi:DNA-3-methyladenine glycosylase II
VKGIGRWTAEMFLMFTLCRPDVLPAEDLGVRVAIQRAYDLPDRPGRVEMERIAEPWKPFRSAASFYLWRSLTTP